MSSDPKPWERQPGESGPAWAAFTQYRDLPPSQRSLSRVASDMLSGDPTDPLSKPQRKGTHGSVRTDLARWSSRHHWVARVEAWDRDADQRQIEQRRAEIREMNERHAETAKTTLDVLMAPVAALAQRIEQDPAVFDEMGLSELFTLADKLARHVPGLSAMERQASGLAADQPGPSGAQLPPLEDSGEWLAGIFEALAEAGLDAAPDPSEPSTAEPGEDEPVVPRRPEAVPHPPPEDDGAA